MTTVIASGRFVLVVLSVALAGALVASLAALGAVTAAATFGVITAAALLAVIA